MFKKLFSNQKFIIFFSGLLVSLLVSALYVFQPYLIRQLDRNIYDIYLRSAATQTISPTPAIIDIDEASLEAYGQWPWPRHLLASLLKILTESGAASIGFDIMFAEPDRSSPVVLQNSLKDNFNVEMTFNDLPEYLEDNDKLFASVIRQTPTVLGSYVQFKEGDALVDTKSIVADKGLGTIPKDLPKFERILERTTANAINPLETIIKGSGAILPLPALRNEAPLASLNVAPDPDGIVRAIPLILQVEDRIFLSLGLRALMRGLGEENLILEGGSYGLQKIYLGKYEIPIAPNGLFQIPFQGPRGTYPYFSAKDILDGKVPPEELQGRVLLVGTSASGLLDIRATPFDSIYPGVESHAAVIDAILSNRSIERPVWVPFAQIITILFLGVLSTFVFGFTSAFLYLPAFAILIGGSVGSTWYLFLNKIFISPVYALITIIVLMVFLLGVRFIFEVKQKRQLRKAFSRYVSPEMVNRIADRGEAVLAGEEREVTLIFTDIRGFTSLSEQLAPGEIVSVLNRYFTPMTGLIRENEGTIDKFIGDAIMAFWNAPLDIEGHELKAVKTALNMQKELALLNVELKAEYGVEIRMGAGVHSGKVYVGNMGTEEMLDYTCIGDSVNLTSRLEGLCSHYGVVNVVSSATVDKCKILMKKELFQDLQNQESIKDEDLPLHFISLDSIQVKGKEEPVDIFMPWHKEEALKRKEELSLFEKVREHYSKGDFATALPLIKRLSEEYPEIKYYHIYLERCEELQNEKPADWNGVWRFTKK